MECLTAAEMRAIERAAIDSGAVTGLELMERAGQGVVEAMLEEWPDLAQASPKYATVIAGPGNNGGDGFVITRLLRARGWYVDLMALGRADAHGADATANLHRLSPRPYFVALSDAGRYGSAIYETETQLVIDAVFGIGLRRPLSDEVMDLLCNDLSLYREDDLGTKCVAVDIPSGLDADTGTVVGGAAEGAFKAHLTVTFHAAKHGHVLAQGPEYCGKVMVKDIGL